MKIYIVDVDGELFVGELTLKEERFFELENSLYYGVDREYKIIPITPENPDNFIFRENALEIHEYISPEGPPQWEAYLYEGGHWERGDRDCSTSIPGYLPGWDNEDKEFVTFSAEEAEEVAKTRRESYKRKKEIENETRKLKENLSKISIPTPWVGVGEIEIKKIASRLDNLEALRELEKLIGLLDAALSGF